MAPFFVGSGEQKIRSLLEKRQCGSGDGWCCMKQTVSSDQLIPSAAATRDQKLAAALKHNIMRRKQAGTKQKTKDFPESSVSQASNE
jgi:hypothetical protein